MKVVINFDYPQSSEDYIHRIGRTGRLQQSGTSYAFFTSNNMRHANELISVLRETNQLISPQLLEMAELAKTEAFGKNKNKNGFKTQTQKFQRGAKNGRGRGNVRGGIDQKMNRGKPVFGTQDNFNRFNGGLQRGGRGNRGAPRGKQRGGVHQRMFNQNEQSYYQPKEYNNQPSYNNNNIKLNNYDMPPPTHGYDQVQFPMAQFNVPPPGYNNNMNQCIQYPISY